mgnify:CR=1 FL=1
MEDKQKCILSLEYEIDAGGRRIKKIQEDLTETVKNLLSEENISVTSLKIKVVNASS